MGKRNTRPLLARCVEGTGTLSTAILLYRICYWHPHAKAEAEGKLWIAKSRDDWMEETGLTLHQYRTGRSELTRLSYVEARNFAFAGRRMTFIRLLDRGRDMRSKPSMRGAGTLHEGGCSPPSYIKGDTKGDTKGDNLSGNPDGIACETPPVMKKKNFLADNNSPNYVATSKEADMVSIAEQLKQTKRKPVKKGQTIPPFHSVWSKAVADATGDYQTPLTAKKMGQLKHFAKACPPGKSEIVALTIIGDWHLFTQTVKSATGQFTLPSKPSIEFALKHVQQAVSFWGGQKQTEETPEPEAPAVVQLTAKPAPTDDHAKASKAEMAAILFEEDDAD